MDHYYVEIASQPNGDHLVHRLGCSRLLGLGQQNVIHLGEFWLCDQAVEEAGEYYSRVNGCFLCSESCHSLRS